MLFSFAFLSCRSRRAGRRFRFFLNSNDQDKTTPVRKAKRINSNNIVAMLTSDETDEKRKLERKTENGSICCGNFPRLCRLSTRQNERVKMSETLFCNWNFNFCTVTNSTDLDNEYSMVNWIGYNDQTILSWFIIVNFVIVAQTFARHRRMQFLFIFLSCCCFPVVWLTPRLLSRHPSRAQHFSLVI